MLRNNTFCIHEKCIKVPGVPGSWACLFSRRACTCSVHAAWLDGAELKQREASTRDGTRATSRVTADLEKSHRSSLNNSSSTFLSDTGWPAGTKNKKLVCSLGPVCKTEQRLMVRALIRAMTMPVLMATPRLSHQLHCQVKYTGAEIHVQDYSWKADCAMRRFISGRPLHFMNTIIWSEWTLIWFDRFQCTHALPVADTQWSGLCMCVSNLLTLIIALIHILCQKVPLKSQTCRKPRMRIPKRIHWEWGGKQQ